MPSSVRRHFFGDRISARDSSVVDCHQLNHNYHRERRVRRGSFSRWSYTDTPIVRVAIYPFVTSPLSVASSYCVPSEKTLSDALRVVFCPCAAYTPVRYTADDTSSGNAICVVFTMLLFLKICT